MRHRERVGKIEKKMNIKIFYKVPGDVLAQIYEDSETGQKMTRTEIYQKYAGKIQFALLEHQDRDL